MSPYPLASPAQLTPPSPAQLTPPSGAEAPRRRLTPFIVLLACAALSSSCRAGVDTSFAVSPPPQIGVEIFATVEFDAAAAQALDPVLQARLESVIRSRTGTRPSVTRDTDGLRLQLPLSYGQLDALSGLTGVSDVRLELIDDTLGILHIELVEPDELRAAIVDAASRQPDASALAPVLLSYSYVQFSVLLPGQVLEVVTPDIAVAPRVSGRTVVVTQPLDRYTPGTLSVGGSLVAERPSRLLPALVSFSSLALAALALWWVRRRS